MDRLLLLLVQPLHWNENEEDWVGVSKDAAEMERRWDEWERLKRVLSALGFHELLRPEVRDETVSIEWNNGEGKAVATCWTLSPAALALLEGGASEQAAFRDRALAKLTPQEQWALGILKQP